VQRNFPSVSHNLDIPFGDKLRLIGYDLNVKRGVKPRDRLKLVLYWRVDRRLEPGWKLSTKVLDDRGKTLMDLDKEGPLRQYRNGAQVAPMSDWQEGFFYTDEVPFRLPRRLRTKELSFEVGIVKDGNFLEPKGGKEVRHGQFTLVKVPVEQQEKEQTAPKVETLKVKHLGEGVKLKLDGKLDEPAWQAADFTRQFVSQRWSRVYPKSPRQGRAKMLWDDKRLYVGFEIRDEDILGGIPRNAKDPPLWKRGAVELLIQPSDKQGNKDYYQILVGPQNMVFDSQFDDFEKPNIEPAGPFGHSEWTSKLTAGVKLDGTLDNPVDIDQGYVIEMAIPWISFGKANHVPPVAGEIWKMNLSMVHNDWRLVWSALGRNSHKKQVSIHDAGHFGHVVFESTPAPSSEAPRAVDAAPTDKASAPPGREPGSDDPDQNEGAD